ncbi:MAG: Asp-tRNA(Asn)/Glu-tRNA(Gln) amidotransferase subunit GatC [Clostridiaceae bacterium]|jgi:aspartyl/glutamyl-tRNA(Asn/Gln) amidotransferase C subunit|nr:Asp-tRNA(Asn)/Glu-tRNA(Gln) amidotransferase subunit GatC [Clostridiaceae bacterium]
MSAADVKTISKMADMAAIYIDEKELEIYASQLDEVIRYMEEIKSLDTDDEEPMEHILAVKNVFREDVVTGENIRDEFIKNTSIDEDGYFKVLAVVELI